MNLTKQNPKKTHKISELKIILKKQQKTDFSV